MNIFRLTIFLFFASVLFSAIPVKADDPDAIVGKWLSSKKRNQVQIYKQGNKYFGRLVWMLEPNDPVTKKPKMDLENPDEQLRSRQLMQTVLLTNLTYKGKNMWTDGEIYNPEDGKTYSCDVTMKDPNTLDFHGYVMGIRFIGTTKTWTRVK